MGAPPLVTVGLPVYNGERFLRRTIESILAQEFRDFELRISDNASTDRTEEICREYAARDPRVSYHRNAENIGAPRNFNHLFQNAASKYFIWVSAHDQLGPMFLARCVQVMEQDPSVVLCYTDCACIDDDGRVFMTLPHQVDTRGLDLRGRYKAVLWNLHCYAVYGLHRSEALRQVFPIRPTMGSDNILLAELACLGAFASIPEQAFYFRVMKNFEDLAAHLSLLNLKLTGWNAPRLFFDFTREHLAAVRRRTTKFSDRFRLSVSTLARLAKTGCGFFGLLNLSGLFPRAYPKMVKWLLHRTGGGGSGKPTVHPPASDGGAATKSPLDEIKKE